LQPHNLIIEKKERVKVSHFKARERDANPPLLSLHLAQNLDASIALKFI